MIASLAVASLAIGLASWASWSMGRWHERELRASPARMLTERQAAERAALADMSEALRKLAIEDSTLLMFDGENVRQVSYRGAPLNSYKGGSC